MCRDSASKNSFPNLAGFARSLGVGLGDLEKICGKYPEQYDAVLALLEDEALNCGQSPTENAGGFCQTVSRNTK